MVIATKGGFIPFDGGPPRSQQEFFGYVEKTFIQPGIIKPADIVAGCHCMTPAYLQHQLDASLHNLGLECVDIYYVHNPETQLEEVPRVEFVQRMRAAFQALEANTAAGKLRWSGTATWEGYRRPPDARIIWPWESLSRRRRTLGVKDTIFGRYSCLTISPCLRR